MSQKVRITGVKHSGGSVYLGEKDGNPTWTKNPNRVMDYLSDGWRSRFNQHRAHRAKRRKVLDLETQEEMWVDIPLGGPNTSEESLTDKEARQECSWLSALPAMVISSARNVEDVEWWAAKKRIKTLREKGLSPKECGELPEFKSFKRQGQGFVCWYNGAQNAIFRRTGRKSGIVTITGKTPKALQRPGEPSRWKLQIRVRVSQPIRPYTSVRVNWTKRQLVFVNSPLPVTTERTGAVIGIDMGVANTFTTSDGEHFHTPKESLETQQEYLRLQRKMARQDRVNTARANGDKKAKYKSNRRARTVREINRIKGHETRRREDWMHRVTTQIVRDFDLIVMEDLQVKNMTKSAKGTVLDPGKNVRQKAGLNRAILSNSWGLFRSMLEYKSALANKTFIAVNPAYTSQQCSECGHTARENRESQAEFKCIECSHSQHADINAAKNILGKGLVSLTETGQDYGLGRGGEVRPSSTPVLDGTTDEASTPALVGSAA